MGNFYQNISASTSVLASSNTWIEGLALQQLENTARLQGMQRVVGMPDLHPGRGYPVGAAFFSTGYLYPALVGNDIGCGMGLWQTELRTARLNLDKLERRLGNMDGPLGAAWAEDIAALQLPHTGHEQALGTIGGGNHFAELQQLEEIYDAAAAQSLKLDEKRLFLLVHSGSRGLGQAILSDHIAQFGHAGLEDGTPACTAYLQQHDTALRFAKANRILIGQRLLNRIATTGTHLFDTFHNHVERISLDGKTGWLHRKGATPATTGFALLPGSRGDYCYVVQPVADEQSLFSLAHGAGRKWQRGDCRARLRGRFRMEQLSHTPLGGRVICKHPHLIYEEAPEAYKPVETVLNDLEGAGLLKRVARLKPVLTYKTAAGEA